MHEYSGGLQMAPSSLDKQTANCDSPHNWLMSLAIDLATCVTCGGENNTIGCHLAVFSEDIAFANYFMVPHPPPPYRSASSIGYIPVKNIQNERQFS